jgi:hypothetical protein
MEEIPERIEDLASGTGNIRSFFVVQLADENSNVFAGQMFRGCCNSSNASSTTMVFAAA